MSRLVLMAIIAAGVVLASCQTDQRSLFADDRAAHTGGSALAIIAARSSVDEVGSSGADR
jgi:hypothetical protein